MLKSTLCSDTSSYIVEYFKRQLKFEVMVKFIFLFFILFCLGRGEASTPVLLRRAVEALKTPASVTNTWLGVVSRSWGIIYLINSLRVEEDASKRESLDQVLVTLAVLDIGGGVIAPWLDDTVTSIANDEAFKNTRDAFEVGISEWESLIDPDINEGERTRRIADSRQGKKAHVKTTWNNDLSNLGSEPNHRRILNQIGKTRRYLKVKAAGGLIGPLFDLASVGVNGWALGTSVRDCINDRATCDYLTITSAALSIASGLVGLGTFVNCVVGAASIAGPFGPLAAALLGITATIIEITSRVIPTPADTTSSTREVFMKQLAYSAKLQLFDATAIMQNAGTQENDIYFVNQGHLLKWDESGNSLDTIDFGWDTRVDQPRTFSLEQTMCSTPSHPGTPTGQQPRFESTETHFTCPYLVDGVELFSINDPSVSLGYGFYGFAKNYGEYSDEEPTRPPYNGVTVIVRTDMVKPDKLSHLEESTGHDELRGLRIYTNTKAGNYEPFNDIVAIGDMPNLNTQEPHGGVLVRTGKGDDVLNIHGRIGPFTSNEHLRADLGDGYNILSFGKLDSNSGIEGIIFDAASGNIHFKHGSESRQHVGKVENVSVLQASEFTDEIQLGLPITSPENTVGGDYDFVVLKLKGLATYKLYISMLAIQERTGRFLIVDETKRIMDDSETRPDPPMVAFLPGSASTCEGHVPVLQLLNFQSGAKTNDILYQNDKILVYGEHTVESGEETTRKEFVRDVEEGEGTCDGERGGNPTMDSNERTPLAIINIRSSCPIEIEAIASDGSCVMRRRKKHELDTHFFPGFRLRIDFSEQTYQGSEVNDYAILECPSSEVSHSTSIDLGGGSDDYLVIGRNLFLDPCGLDGVDATMRLIKDVDNGNVWNLVFGGSSVRKFTEEEARTISITGLEKFLDEYGNVVLRLDEDTPNELDLYEKYSSLSNIAEDYENDHGNEIKNNLFTCVNGNGDITAEERIELCETNE
jgi:hypothetical protein